MNRLVFNAYLPSTEKQFAFCLRQKTVRILPKECDDGFETRACGWSPSVPKNTTVKSDNFYIQNWSLVLDLRFMAMTVPDVVRRAEWCCGLALLSIFEQPAESGYRQSKVELFGHQRAAGLCERDRGAAALHHRRHGAVETGGVVGNR